MDELGQKACECFEKHDPDKMGAEEATTQIGVCMIVEAQAYKKKIQKDFGIDMNDIEGSAEELGQIVGMHMIKFCPEALIALASKEEVMEYVDDEEEIKSLDGSIVGIEDQQFVIFTLEDENGKRTRLVWMESFPNEFGLEDNYMSLKGAEAKLEYVEREFYDPRISQYRKFKVIRSLVKL